jgi:hypothetical protein
MIRSAHAIALLLAFAASPAHAAVSDCISNYREFWELMQRHGHAKPSTEDLIATQRRGLRAFDACQSGDEANFANFWEDMRKYGNSKDDAQRFWAEMQHNASARK